MGATAEVSVDEAGKWSLAVDVRCNADTLIICEETDRTFGVVLMGDEVEHLADGLSSTAVLNFIQLSY